MSIRTINPKPLRRQRISEAVYRLLMSGAEARVEELLEFPGRKRTVTAAFIMAQGVDVIHKILGFQRVLHIAKRPIRQHVKSAVNTAALGGKRHLDTGPVFNQRVDRVYKLFT